MLKDKYRFKADYDQVAFLCAHLKALQQRAVVTPHIRKEGKSIELLMCSILKPVAKRIDAKLFEYSSKVVFELKQAECLAFHAAYKYNWLPKADISQEIFETIDRVI